MAENVTIGTGVSAGTAQIAADVVDGVYVQRIKVQHGADGAAVDASSSAPLPVAFPSGTIIDVRTVAEVADANMLDGREADLSAAEEGQALGVNAEGKIAPLSVVSETREGSAYTYDAAGNVATATVDGVTTTFTYDDEDNVLTASRPGRVETYSYDGGGNVTGSTVVTA